MIPAEIDPDRGPTVAQLNLAAEVALHLSATMAEEFQIRGNEMEREEFKSHAENRWNLINASSLLNDAAEKAFNQES